MGGLYILGKAFAKFRLKRSQFLVGGMGRSDSIDLPIGGKFGDRRDAERLAAMWNASDAGWPGGWTHGGGSIYELKLTLTGGAGDLFKFKTVTPFVTD